MAMFAPVAGAAIGAGLMYVLDPIAGARRRAMVRDQLVSARSRLDDVACATWRDLGNRADGMWAEFLGRFAPEQVGDDVLRERVRAELGSLVRYPGLVEVQADNGLVVLAGAVPADEAQELIRCVRAIRGVTRVENRLDVYRQPADLPGVQGPIPPARTGRRFELMQRNWSPAARTLVGGAGALTMLAAPRRGPIAGIAMMALGALALLRALSNEPIVNRGARTARGGAWRERGQQTSGRSEPGLDRNAQLAGTSARR